MRIGVAAEAGAHAEFALSADPGRAGMLALSADVATGNAWPASPSPTAEPTRAWVAGFVMVLLVGRGSICSSRG